MHELARLSEAERRRIVDDFLDEVLGDLDVDPEFAERMRRARPDLPDLLLRRRHDRAGR